MVVPLFLSVLTNLVSLLLCPPFLPPSAPSLCRREQGQVPALPQLPGVLAVRPDGQGDAGLIGGRDAHVLGRPGPRSGAGAPAAAAGAVGMAEKVHYLAWKKERISVNRPNHQMWNQTPDIVREVSFSLKPS